MLFIDEISFQTVINQTNRINDLIIFVVNRAVTTKSCHPTRVLEGT